MRVHAAGVGFPDVLMHEATYPSPPRGLRRVKRRDGGGDVVLDGIGGPTAIRSLRALCGGGRLVLFGHHATLRNGRRTRAALASFYAAGAATVALGALCPGRRVTSYQVAKEMRRHFERFSADLQQLFGYLAQGEIHPVVAARLPLSEAARAHEMLGAGEVVGKLVLITGAADRA
jgi:NADPH2:quinone reductase